MKAITVQDLKSKGASVIEEDRPTYLIVNSKVKSVLVPPEQYEALVEAYEDLEDIRDAYERMNDETISFEEAIKEIESK